MANLTQPIPNLHSQSYNYAINHNHPRPVSPDKSQGRLRANLTSLKQSSFRAFTALKPTKLLNITLKHSKCSTVKPDDFANTKKETHKKDLPVPMLMQPHAKGCTPGNFQRFSEIDPNSKSYTSILNDFAAEIEQEANRIMALHKPLSYF